MHHRKLREIVAGQSLLNVNSKTLVVDVAKRMRDRNVAAVLVIDDGEMVGIFTERDMLRRVVAHGRDSTKTKIADVMTKNVATLDGSRLGFEAVALMIERNIRHIAVTGLPDSGYGIVSMRDFAHSELSSFERELQFEQEVWSSI